ncbi:MAG TPA: DUF2267 domain-containing protein [Longimicrobiales bacterium]
MARDARDFWHALERRLPDEDRPREEDIARSVLVLLRSRIRPEEARHLREALPAEIKELWATPGTGVAEEHTGRPIDELDHNRFIERVRDLNAFPDMQRAARAAAAVFGAVREVISDTEADHVEHQLPAGLKELWRGDHAAAGPHIEQGPSPFWDLLADRLEGRVPASVTDVACTVLAHLRGRLSPRLVADIGGALPDDVREYWVAPEGGAEADETPERFLGRIAGDLGTADLDHARIAAAACLAALRRSLPEALDRRIRDELPQALQGFWDAG